MIRLPLPHGPPLRGFYRPQRRRHVLPQPQSHALDAEATAHRRRRHVPSFGALDSEAANSHGRHVPSFGSSEAEAAAHCRAPRRASSAEHGRSEPRASSAEHGRSEPRAVTDDATTATDPADTEIEEVSKLRDALWRIGTGKDLRSIGEAFDKADHDRSGALSTTEMALLMSALGVPLPLGELETLADRIVSVDGRQRPLHRNGKGQVTRDDFVLAVRLTSVDVDMEDRALRTAAAAAMNALAGKLQDVPALPGQEPLGKQYARARVGVVFKQFDLDNSKTLSREELRQALASLKVALDARQLARLIRRIDVDGDGQLRIGEFEDLFFGDHGAVEAAPAAQRGARPTLHSTAAVVWHGMRIKA